MTDEPTKLLSLTDANSRLLALYKLTPEYRQERDRKNRTARVRHHRRREATSPSPNEQEITLSKKSELEELAADRARRIRENRQDAERRKLPLQTPQVEPLEPHAEPITLAELARLADAEDF